MLHHLSTRCSFRAGHMLLSHFEPVLKFKVARPLSPEEKNHCEVMVITYRLGVGRRKSENSFGCVVLQFSSIPCLGSELAVNSPLSMFSPPPSFPLKPCDPPPSKSSNKISLSPTTMLPWAMNNEWPLRQCPSNILQLSCKSVDTVKPHVELKRPIGIHHLCTRSYLTL